MTLFPDATYLWYVDLDTFIMNPQLSIEKDVMGATRLQDMMIVDHPVVPPDSIIHTFSHLRGEDVDLVLTQDAGGLATASFILRNSEWSRYFTETWFDPIYRSYNFQKAETHALVSTLPREDRSRSDVREHRNTSSSGTLRSCPDWPWFHNAPSTPIRNQTRATSTRRAISRFGSPNAPNRTRTPLVGRTRSRTRWSGGPLTGAAERDIPCLFPSQGIF